MSTTNTNWPHVASWFEIPCTDFSRACTFFEAVLDTQLIRQEMTTNMDDPMKMGLFPHGENSVGGAIVHHKELKPLRGGVLLYLSAGRDLQSALDRIEPAGGKVIVPKTLISKEVGYFAVFLDTEGNELALHSPE